MLNNIRNLANHIIVKIFLAFIAISFVIWGIKSAMVGSNNQEIVIFKNAPSISESEFNNEKIKQRRLLDQNSSAPLNLDERKESQLDSYVLKKMITERMISYLAKFYGLEISQDALIKALRNYDTFQNLKGEFDINLFNSSFASTYQKQEYVTSLKQNISRNVMLSIFLEGYNPSVSAVDNVIKYLSEARNVDLVSLKLYEDNKEYNFTEPSEEELEKFYEQNHDLFKEPESRSFTYLKITFDDILNNIKIPNDEALAYFKEHKEEFKSSNFINAKKQVIIKIKEQRLDKTIFDLVKNLEEDVASGLNLHEISNKYYGILAKIEKKTHAELKNNEEFSKILDQIFELTEGEVSYPYENLSKKNIIIVELNNIKEAKLPKLDKIKTQVLEAFKLTKLADYNIQEFEIYAKNFKPGSANSKILKQDLPVKIEKLAINRSEIHEKDLPLDLLLLIFQEDIGTSTPIVKHNDKLYFAYIKSVNIDGKKFREIEKNSRDNIISTLKNGLMEEIIGYYINENNTQIRNFEKN